MKYNHFALMLGLLLFSGCAHAISEQSIRLADPSIQFGQLRTNPDAFTGKTAIVGGVIAGAYNTPEGGIIEVVQYNLADDLVPNDSEESGGRFLATIPEFINPAEAKPGQLVTIVGEIKGKRLQKIDETPYSFPILSIREMRIWNSGASDELPVLPRHYDPYYWGYPGDPYRDRPIGPIYKR